MKIWKKVFFLGALTIHWVPVIYLRETVNGNSSMLNSRSFRRIFMPFIISKNTKITKATIAEVKFENLSRIVLSICYFFKAHTWQAIKFRIVRFIIFVNEGWKWSIMLKFGYWMVRLKSSLTQFIFDVGSISRWRFIGKYFFITWLLVIEENISF